MAIMRSLTRTTLAERAAVCVAIGLAFMGLALSSPPASAESLGPGLDALDAADSATQAAARASGIDVIQIVRYSQRTDLRKWANPNVVGTVAARGRIRVHGTVNADQSFYESVRHQPSGKLIGAQGREFAGAPLWATVSLLWDDYAAKARSNGATNRTAITKLPSAEYLYGGYSNWNPYSNIMRLILPPYSDAMDEGWSNTTATPQVDGTTLIRGDIRAQVGASDGEDSCVRPIVEMVVGPDNIARSSHWIETCPGLGTREVWALATYGPQLIQPPTNPQMTSRRAFR